MANTLHQTIVSTTVYGSTGSTTFQALQASPFESYFIAKDADQAVTNSTTLANDTQLTFALTNTTDRWWFRFHIGFNLAGTTSGYKFAITGPATPNNVRYRMCAFNGVTPGALSCSRASGAFADTMAVTLAVAGDHWAEIEGFVEGNGAGSVTLQFAQNVLDAVNSITVKRGSFVQAQRIT